MMRGAISAVVFATVTFTGALAHGSDRVAAEALFREGRDAMRRGDARAACDHFAESERLDPAVGTVLNLAECSEMLGRIATAWAHLRQAVDDLPPNDDRVSTAMKKVAALEPRLPRLVVRLASSAPGDTKVTRDDVAIGATSFAIAIPVDPGAHVIVAEAPGHAARTYRVALREGERLEIIADVGERIAPPAAPEKPPAPAGGSSGRLPGWLLLAGSGVAIGVGSVTGLLAIDRDATMDARCEPGRLCDVAGADAGREGRVFDTVSTVSFIAAGALLGAGIIWLVTHPPREARGHATR
jgi:hypothetical protein